MNPLIQQQKLIEWCWVPDSASDSNNTLSFSCLKVPMLQGRLLPALWSLCTDTFLPAFHAFQSTKSLHGCTRNASEINAHQVILAKRCCMLWYSIKLIQNVVLFSVKLC